MTVSTITRNFNGVQNFVQFNCNDSISAITTAGYLISDPVVESINDINNGSFEFFENDLILITYDVSFGLFTYNATNNCFNVSYQGNSVLTYLPTITFQTPGNLSVVYTNQSGTIYIKGKEVSLNISLQFTPTYTTAAGNFIINAPFVNFRGLTATVTTLGTNVTFPAGVTQVNPAILLGSNSITLRGMGSTTDTTFGVTQFVSGTQYTMTVQVIYLMQ